MGHVKYRAQNHIAFSGNIALILANLPKWRIFYFLSVFSYSQTLDFLQGLVFYNVLLLFVYIIFDTNLEPILWGITKKQWLLLAQSLQGRAKAVSSTFPGCEQYSSRSYFRKICWGFLERPGRVLVVPFRAASGLGLGLVVITTNQ